jgi:hypothetical protein
MPRAGTQDLLFSPEPQSSVDAHTCSIAIDKDPHYWDPFSDIRRNDDASIQWDKEAVLELRRIGIYLKNLLLLLTLGPTIASAASVVYAGYFLYKSHDGNDQIICIIQIIFSMAFGMFFYSYANISSHRGDIASQSRWLPPPQRIDTEDKRPGESYRDFASRRGGAAPRKWKCKSGYEHLDLGL